jgi:hypothetical protein
VHDATADAVLIREWWRRWPTANIGIATGAPSGLVVVDVDLPKGGRESLRAMKDSGRRLPSTLTACTGGGGLHLFYAGPQLARVPNAVGRLPGGGERLPGIDVRGDGGYVVAPPSVHASGTRYRWRGGTLAPLPAWAWPRPRRQRPFPTTSPVSGAIASAYGAAALARQLVAVRSLAVGSRNDGLNRAAFSLGRLVGGGELPESLVFEALLSASMATGLGEGEAERTIRSGLGAGRAVPRRPAPPRRSTDGDGRRGAPGSELLDPTAGAGAARRKG